MPVIGTNTIIDISSFQGHPDFAALKAAGIVGVLHKATEGVGFHDANYAANKAAAKAAGLKWGAYHFGTGSNPAAQADEFLQVAGLAGDELAVLDFEDNTHGTQMALTGARTFVQRIFDKLGRWPGFYSGNTIRDALGANVDPLLANCWLWVAQYNEGPPLVQNSWKDWTLWQYTDGGAGPQPHGVGPLPACDRDSFNGSAGDLDAFWSSGGVTRPAAALATV